MTDDLTVSVEHAPATEWDAFALQTPGGTFCHLSGWHSVMEEVLGHQALYLTARDASGAPQGLLPLVRVRSLLFGHYLVSMPFLNYGGAIGSAPARDLLARRAQEEASSTGAGLLELRWRRGALGSPQPTDEITLPGGLALNARKVTVLLPLPDDPEALWEKGLRAKVRSQVRRPMKEGYETRFGPDQVEPFYDVFARNMRDLGTPVLPRSLFERLTPALGDRVVFAAVYDRETPIAAGCGFLFGPEFEITWASSLREYNAAAPNMLLYWRLMEHAIERGAAIFNFGRCTPGGGTHRFKLQWGGEDEALPWGAWSPGGTDATPNPDQGKYRLATRVWSRLPLPLTRIIGPPLARRIP